MKRMNQLAGATALTIAAIAAPASAASWSLEKTVTGVEVSDDTNHNLTGKSLNIYLSSAGTYCGTSQSVITIKQSESTLWDHWVRIAEAAYLSGKNLKIFSSNATGACKPWSLTIKNP